MEEENTAAGSARVSFGVPWRSQGRIQGVAGVTPPSLTLDPPVDPRQLESDKILLTQRVGFVLKLSWKKEPAAALVM